MAASGDTYAAVKIHRALTKNKIFDMLLKADSILSAGCASLVKSQLLDESLFWSLHRWNVEYDVSDYELPHTDLSSYQ